MLSGNQKKNPKITAVYPFLDRNSHVMSEMEKHASITGIQTPVSPVTVSASGVPTTVVTSAIASPATVAAETAAQAQAAAAVIETSVNEVTIPSQVQNDSEPSSQLIQDDSNKVEICQGLLLK